MGQCSVPDLAREFQQPLHHIPNIYRVMLLIFHPHTFPYLHHAEQRGVKMGICGGEILVTLHGIYQEYDVMVVEIPLPNPVPKH